MKKYLYFLLFTTSLGFSQKKEGKPLIDSLHIELNKAKNDSIKIFLMNRLSFQYKDLNSNLCLDYAQKALAISKKINYKNGILSSYNNLSIYYTIKSEYDKALQYYNFQLKNTTDKKRISSVYTNMAVLYMYQSNYPKALYYSNLSLNIDESLNDLESQAITLGNIGDIYFETHNLKKALIYFNKSLAINKKLFLKDGISTMLFNKGQCYAVLKNYDKAIQNFNDAIKVDNLIKNAINKASCLDGICEIYLQKKMYINCILKCNEAIDLNLEIDNQSGLSSNYSNLGNAYKEQSLLTKSSIENKELINLAENNFKKALNIELKINDLKRISQLNGSLYELQKIKGNYKQALNYYETCIRYQDTVFNSDNKETIKNLEDKREIELRDKQLKIKQLSIAAQQKQKWFYIAGIAFLMILGGLLMYQNQNRKKTNQKLQLLNTELDKANKVKTRFFGILNHDLRSPVSNLIQFLHLQKDNPEMLDAATKKRIETSTIAGAENLLTSMEDILLWSKGQMENFKPQPTKTTINQLFDDTKKVFSGYQKIQFEYNNLDGIEMITDQNYLKTIVRNLTSNAINAFTETPNPKIIWSAWQKDEKIHLSITDNGPGATQEQFKALYNDNEVVGIKSGLGLHLIRDLAKAIGCEINVESKTGIGTIFTLKLNKFNSSF